MPATVVYTSTSSSAKQMSVKWF